MTGRPPQPWIIRLAHWVNMPVLAIMAASGLQILVAYPYMGPRGRLYEWWPLQGWRPPEWLRLGDWLAGARGWHFAFAWFLVANGLIYVVYLLASGEWRRRLFWPPRDTGQALRQMAYYLRLRKKAPEAGFYNGLQRLAYTSILALGVIEVLSGLAIWKPVQLHFLAVLFGGYDGARVVHLVGLVALGALTAGHLAMVLLHPRTFLDMITGGKEVMITRRKLIGGALVGAALAGCSSDKPRSGFLGAMERFTVGLQRALQSDDGELPRFGDDRLTPDGAFPVYHASAFPPPAPAGWSLAIGGLVARPRTLSLDDLKRLTRTDLRIEHHCVEGWSAIADWHGVRISEIAALVGADPRARFVEFRSFDAGYWSCWDRESALHRHSLLAYGMNGRDLPIKYGAPVRAYSALKLGYKNVKYLTQVSFLDANSGGYWENTGYEWYAGV